MSHLRDRRAFGNIGTRRFRGARFGDALSPRFSGLLDQYGGAAAAYSLRALSSGWLAGDVVEVRRSSDSTSQDFTASQITGGQMLSFVNNDTTSLYNSARYFNRVDTRVAATPVDPVSKAVKFSFLYADASSQQLMLQLGNLSNYQLAVTLNSTNGNNDFSASASATDSAGDGPTFGYNGLVEGQIYDVVLNINASNEIEGGTIGGNALISVAGASRFVINSNELSLGMRSTTGLAYVGLIYNFSVGGVVAYTGRGDTPWLDTIGSNNGTETNGAAYTGQGFDGFVSTWYDQSGNANNATQATTTAQPKIVSAGALVTGGLDFDGVDDFMTTASYAVELSQNSASVFAVYEAGGNNARVLTEGDTAVGGSSQFIIPFEGGSSLFWVNGDETGTKPTGLALIGFDYDQTASTIKAFSNGSQSGAALSNPTINPEQKNYTFIGSNSLGNILFGGTIKEIITYKSDQSATRAAIEANINDFYTIY